MKKAGANTDVVSSMTLPQCFGVPSARNMRDGLVARMTSVPTANMMSASCHLLNTIDIMRFAAPLQAQKKIFTAPF